MRPIRVTTSFLLLAFGLLAQQNQSATAASTTVPRLVRVSNTFHPADGQPAGAVENVTLSIYRDEEGGTPLWQETQNVAVDSEGKYNLLMGSTVNDGVPADLFNSTEPRWLGVKFNRNGEVEQPRTRLASVPYALRASDSETLGGRPASAYLLADPAEAISVTAAATGPGAKAVAKPKTITGLQGYIPVFTDATDDLGDSVMIQAGGDIGIGTVPNTGATTAVSLDLRTYPFSQIGMAQTSDYMSFFASDTYGPAIYWDPAKDMRFGKGGVGLYNAFGFTEQMRIQSSTGNVGIGTQTPGSPLDVVGNINMSGNLLYNGSTLLSTAGAANNANTVLGVTAMPTTSGPSNTAIGYGTLAADSSGQANTAVGALALGQNASGNYNTAVGFSAANKSTGQYNTALGYGALANNTSPSYNTAVGTNALQLANGGAYNIALGYAAGQNVTTNGGNIMIGTLGLSSGGDVNTIRIGGGTSGIADNVVQTSFYAAGIANATISGVNVLINTSTGQLGVASSSRRFKEDIRDMGSASDGLMRLRPVTFRYKQAFDDGTKPIQYGLIAEEVADVYPELVAHTADGQIETVKYQVLDSMLLNEVQKQQAEIKALQEQNQALTDRLARIEALLATAPAGNAH